MSYQKTYIEDRPKNYFKLHRLILKICGICFTPNQSIFYRLYSFFILSITLFLYPILATHESFKHDFETSSGILLYEIGTIAAAIKAFFMVLNRVNIEKLLTKLEQEPFLPNPNRGGEEEERLNRECIRKTNLQTNIYWLFTAGSTCVYSFYGLSTRLRSSDYHKWQLPYNPLTILDITYSPNYEITWIYQVTVLCVTSCVYVITDLIVAGVLAHISYQFKILQIFLRDIVESSHQEMLKDNVQIQITRAEPVVTNWKYLKKSIKEAVEYHLAILNLAKEMEKYFRNLVLGSFLGVLAILCFQIYMIASTENTNSVILRHIMEYLNSTLPIVMVCYWGEKLLFESEGVGNAAFASDFVGSDIRFQKALAMIIRRSQTPVKLTAGKFADVCMNTCFWILRASYSVCMVLRHVNKK